MTQKQNNWENMIRKNMIILLSIIGLMVCIAGLFPQVRWMIIDFAVRILHREPYSYQSWLKTFLSYAMGGICFILFLDYCMLTNSGRALVQKVKQETKECLSEIDFRSLIKPLLLMFGVYLLGILTIIRANFSYMDDLGRSAEGYREWFSWNRYVSEVFSIIVHGDTNMTDISPLPQLLAILILAISSVLLVYIVSNKKITTVRLLASIPLGLSPYFIGCLSYKFDAPYMALSILANIVPFLFISRKKVFFFFSTVSLLIMCMTYQAASGIYLMIVLILCFQDWNSRKKSNKEILSFLWMAVFAFCFALLAFRFFLMKPIDYYVSSTMFPLHQIIQGTLGNINQYATAINHDFGVIWKIGIVLVLFFFITKSTGQSAQKKLLSFIVSILIVGISFMVSYGVYSLMTVPFYAPRALFGFGVFLAVLSIYIVSDYKKIAVVAVLALNWCLFGFAFSYGNALADQARYAEFRVGILLHDLSALYPDPYKKDLSIQLKSSIDYTPSIKNIAKHYPVIEQLVPKRLEADDMWGKYYLSKYFNFYTEKNISLSIESPIDFSVLNLPVVLDSYYHTIQSDGNRMLIILKH